MQSLTPDEFIAGRVETYGKATYYRYRTLFEYLTLIKGETNVPEEYKLAVLIDDSDWYGKNYLLFTVQNFKREVILNEENDRIACEAVYKYKRELLKFYNKKHLEYQSFMYQV